MSPNSVFSSEYIAQKDFSRRRRLDPAAISKRAHGDWDFVFTQLNIDPGYLDPGLCDCPFCKVLDFRCIDDERGIFFCGACRKNKQKGRIYRAIELVIFFRYEQLSEALDSIAWALDLLEARKPTVIRKKQKKRAINISRLAS